MPILKAILFVIVLNLSLSVLKVSRSDSNIFFGTKIYAEDTVDQGENVVVIRVLEIIFLNTDFKSHTVCYRVNFTFKGFEFI